MRLPYLTPIRQNMLQGNTFQGIKRDAFGSINAFWDMDNMTGEDAPIVRTRGKRFKLRTISNCGALFARDSIGWVSGKELWYDGEKVCALKTTGEKIIANMGAYIVVFPDKVAYNTATKEVLELENSTEAVCTYSPCDILGEDVEAAAALYVRIEGTGIAAGFKGKDVVEISNAPYRALNGTLQIEAVVNSDMMIVLGTMDAKETTSGNKLRVKRLCPDMDFVTECDNRLWGCSSANHEVYACKLGDPTNWRNYQGLADDAYAVTVGSVGDFTGAVTHLGYVYMFKDAMQHKLFGNKPSNYQLTSSHVRGVATGSEKSPVIHNETLYFHSRDGMCMSNGALPQRIDAALGNERHINVKCGAARGRVYASMEAENGGTCIYTYDTERDTWHKELGAAKAFAEASGHLYMLDDNDVLWCLTGRGDPVLADSNSAWEQDVQYSLETGELEMADLWRKRLNKVMVRMTLDAGATCRLMVSYDGGPWQMLANIQSGKDLTAKTVPFVPRRCDRMRIRMQGTGMMRLYNLNLITTGGSEIG